MFRFSRLAALLLALGTMPSASILIEPPTPMPMHWWETSSTVYEFDLMPTSYSEQLGVSEQEVVEEVVLGGVALELLCSWLFYDGAIRDDDCLGALG